MSDPRPAAVVVLAAGEGTRMKSATPKVLHRIGGRSLIGHALAAARAVDPHQLVVVVRHGRDQVAAEVTGFDAAAVVVDQDEIPGTGRAVQCALDAIPDAVGTVLVTYGDVPLLGGAALTGLVADAHRERRGGDRRDGRRRGRHAATAGCCATPTAP